MGERAGSGTATVCLIVKEVCHTIVASLWEKFVGRHMPNTFDALRTKMEEFDLEWQFQYCFGAVDGCHLPIKCPNGGPESCKEYQNFKNFYSTVIMGIVDAKYQSMWASSGYPGNSYDAMILQSTHLFHIIEK